MNTFSTHEPATPLTVEDAADAQIEDLGALVVAIDGKLYHAEDLYRCGFCALQTPNPGELDEDGLCVECADEASAETEHVRQLSANYYASLL